MEPSTTKTQEWGHFLGRGVPIAKFFWASKQLFDSMWQKNKICKKNWAQNFVLIWVLYVSTMQKKFQHLLTPCGGDMGSKIFYSPIRPQKTLINPHKPCHIIMSVSVYSTKYKPWKCGENTWCGFLDDLSFTMVSHLNHRQQSQAITVCCVYKSSLRNFQ